MDLNKLKLDSATTSGSSRSPGAEIKDEYRPIIYPKRRVSIFRGYTDEIVMGLDILMGIVITVVMGGLVYFTIR